MRQSQHNAGRPCGDDGSGGCATIGDPVDEEGGPPAPMTALEEADALNDWCLDGGTKTREAAHDEDTETSTAEAPTTSCAGSSTDAAEEEPDAERSPAKDGAAAGRNLLAQLRALPERRGPSSGPYILSTDEYQLQAMEAREDRENGADALNGETFGIDAGQGWSFEENLAANEELERQKEFWDHDSKSTRALKNEPFKYFSEGYGSRLLAALQRYCYILSANRLFVARVRLDRGDSMADWIIKVYERPGPWSLRPQLLIFAQRALLALAVQEALGMQIVHYKFGDRPSADDGFSAYLADPIVGQMFKAKASTRLTVEFVPWKHPVDAEIERAKEGSQIRGRWQTRRQWARPKHEKQAAQQSEPPEEAVYQ